MSMRVPLWSLMWIVRTMWTALPQTGYIHPDEFFQSVEVVAGDVLAYDVYRTWEFTREAPLRSMLLPSLISSPAFTILYWLGLDTEPNALLVMPRAVMTLLSIVVDVLVYKIAVMLHLDADAVMLVYTSSYITLVYHTRTFSNTLEAFLFVGLMFCVVKAVKEHYQAAERKNRSKLTRSTKDSLRTNPDGIYEVWDIKINTFAIAIIMVAGFFNRPTFIAFAFVPFVYWLINGNTEFLKDRFALFAIVKKTLHIVLVMLIFALIFILCDSMYYKDFDVEAMDDFGFSYALLQFLVIAPLNFIKYNMQTENLAVHSLHPRYLHVLVNAQLLFGFLGLFGTVSFVKTLMNFRMILSHKDVLWKGFLVVSYMLPLALLSIIPHQEPRFLIPLLLPLSLLYSQHIFGMISNKSLCILWVLFNTLCAVFYGSFHQGGLIPAISNIKQQFPQTSQTMRHPAEQYVIFYNTYMPPKYLFANDANSERGIVIHDLKGAEPKELFSLVTKIDYYSTGPYQIFLVMPRTAEYKVCNKTEDIMDVHLHHQFTIHVSLENMPTGRDWANVWNGNLKCTICGEASHCKDGSLEERFLSLFSLNLYQVKLY